MWVNPVEAEFVSSPPALECPSSVHLSVVFPVERPGGNDLHGDDDDAVDLPSLHAHGTWLATSQTRGATVKSTQQHRAKSALVAEFGSFTFSSGSSESGELYAGPVCSPHVAVHVTPQ